MLVRNYTKEMKRDAHTQERGFTLIELSIVLVIIGLIVGGVLVGQDLIRAAEVRATVSQIEKYNTAVNTFRGKYNALPGDMNAATATAFGFFARGSNAGQGDGNGVLEGTTAAGAGNNNGYAEGGENLTFWNDLSAANGVNVNLVDGTFTTYTLPSAPSPAITAATVANYLPAAKLGRGNYVYVFSTNGTNYFGVSPMTTTAVTGASGALTASMSVQQAYQIDKKMDDGLPATGNVTAAWNSGGPLLNATLPVVNSATTDSATSCYNTTTPSYSVNQNSGAGSNCALAFRFQ